MKTHKNILVAFLLNLLFSIMEFIGGILTNSVAIMSDSIHDMIDALSIGLSYFLEKKSNNKPNSKYTYGYVRYSVLGSFITTSILLITSILIIYKSITRLFNPVEINYSGMLIFAVFGVLINFLAAYFTKDGDSLNQKSVNLHMIEDVLGWLVVLIGAIIMKFTDIKIIDPLLSIFVSLFILINALKNIKELMNLFLEKIPNDIDLEKLKKHILKIKGIIDVHHIHIRSIDGYNNYLTMHVVVDSYDKKIKYELKKELEEHNINHSTIEFEEKDENCNYVNCEVKKIKHHNHHHHH